MQPCAWCTVVAAARLHGLANSPEIKSLQVGEAQKAAREGRGTVRAEIIKTAARPGETASEISTAPPTLSTRRKQIQRGGSEAQRAIKPHRDTLATSCSNKLVATAVCVRSEQDIVKHPTNLIFHH